MNKYQDTKYIEINGKKYCPYCGQEMQFSRRFCGYRDWYEFWYCTCDDAQTEASINEKIRQLEQEIETCKRNMPKERFGLVTTIQHL